jgi:ATP-dependent helicase HrpA
VSTEQQGRRRGGRRPGRARGDRAGRAHRPVGEDPAGIAARRERAAAVRRAVEVPPITFPEQLPVSARRHEIAAAMRDHQVVVVSGETGSGKTTQLPKIALGLGRGREGQIGHTQPRRIAARSVAERISEEVTGGPGALGTLVGYQVRFTDTSSEQTLVKVMTDGILLAQIQRDPLLLAYDTLIIDEAHERSLNIDFLLGYLTRLLPRRPDLKVVITSATIDSERFARHFAGPPTTEHPDGVPAPVVEVSGRTYPVEVRYRPLTPDPETDDPDAAGLDGADHDPGDRAAGVGRQEHTGRAETATTGGGRRRAGGRAGSGRAGSGRAGGRGTTRRDAPAPAREEPRDLMTGICEAVDELCAEGPGDILVFLSGEREIRDAEDALRAHLGSDRVTAGGTAPRSPRSVELLPLYSRLSAAEQHRVFEAHPSRRVVLATNVAETSLTVPGVRYVVDPGTARISRWSKATKVQRLPIEPISQASAAQRSGRCGRVADGVAIRLYSEADLASRPEFTEPEILRTSLASVILQMIAVGVAQTPEDVTSFPFVDPPDTRAVRDGVQLLVELGALEQVAGRTRLTDVGRSLALLPIDPRLARMVVEGGRRDVAREVMIIAAALSIQDPRERPAETREQADALHARFADPTSDVLGYLNLWHHVRDQQRDLSGSAFRRMCRAEHLSFLRLREWQDVVTQLKELATPLGIVVRPPSSTGPSAEAAPQGRGALRRDWDADRIHQSVLSGLLSHIGVQEATEVRAGARTGKDARDRADRPDRGGRPRPRNEYAGARGARFAIFPGSALATKPPTWVMAGELVETSRLWARDVARIEPEWAEELAAHLVKRTYSEPTWSAKQGAATALERVTLYGVPIVTGRRALYAKVDPEHARELFLRHALVQGEWTTHHRFFHANRDLLAEATELENRARRRGLVVDDDALFAFYDERVPTDVVSARHFDRWWRDARRQDPDLLTFDLDMLVAGGVDDVRDLAQFPDAWPQGDLELTLTYQFDPGTEHDGVTVHIPVQVLGRVVPDGFDRLVPGMQAELAVATIRALPKPVRVQLVPAPDVAADVVRWLAGQPSWADTVRAGDAAPSWHTTFAQAVRELRGVEIPDDAWDDSRLPSHLRMRFSVHEERRAGAVVLDEGTELVALQRRLATRTEQAVRTAVREAVRAALAGDGAPRPGLSAAATSGGRRAAGDRGGAGDAAGALVADVAARQPGAARSTGLDRDDLTTWPDGLPDGRLPERVATTAGGLLVEGFPTLVATPRPDRPAPVAVRVLAHPDPDRHGVAVRELLLGELALATGRVTSRWGSAVSLAMAASPYPSTAALVVDLQRAALDALLAEADVAGGAGVRDLLTYEGLRDAFRDSLEDRVHAVAADVAAVLDAARELDVELSAARSLALLGVVRDLRAQASALLGEGFVVTAGAGRLRNVVRYLRAARHRLAKAAENLPRDEAAAWQVTELEDAYRAAVARSAATGTAAPDPVRDARLAEVRWMLEELRVSLFAQQLGTPQPVSAKRIRTALAGL